MEKIVRFSITASFLLLGLFISTKMVLAADIEVFWNTPGDPINSFNPYDTPASSATWNRMIIAGNIGYAADQDLNFDVTATIPDSQRRPGLAILKLAYYGTANGAGSPDGAFPVNNTSEVFDHLNDQPPKELIYVNNTRVLFSDFDVKYRRVDVTQTDVDNGFLNLTGTVSASRCSNATANMVIALYIESLGPYSPANEYCLPDDGYIVQDGICIKGTKTTTTYSPALNCPADQGYVYQDGICIKSTVTGVPFCGNNTIEGTEQCDGTNLSGCVANDYCVAPGQANQCMCAKPPTVVLLEPTADYCSGTVIFNWTYASAQSYSQSAWQMQVSTQGNYTNDLIYDSGKTSGSGTNNYFSVFLASNPSTVDHIHYGTLYYWRVKVWDSTDHSSIGYTSYTNSSSSPVNTYTFPYAHPGPAVSYTTTPETPTIDQPVSFTDNNSMCYDNNGSSHFCNVAPNTYQWWFNVDADIKTSLITCSIDNSAICGVASHSYENGIYLTKLQICDPVGAEIGCCYAASNIRVGSGKAVPQWWEISPY